MEPRSGDGLPALPPTQHELPYDDGEPMESDRHYEQMHLLTDTLKDWLWFAKREDWYVAGNRGVYFSLAQARNQDFRAPDVFVVLDVPDGTKERLSWVAWEEGGKLPNVVIEILSPSTEREDRGRKKQIYASIWRLPEYFVFEPFSTRLEGWDLDPITLEYVPKQPNARGDLPVRQMNMTLGVRPLSCYGLPPPSLRWILPDGTPLPYGRERADAEREFMERERDRADVERQRAAAERQRADEESLRAEEQHRRAEQQHRRAEEQHRRAEEQHRRAEEQSRRADEEKQRADRAEEAMRAMREELERQRGAR